MKSTEMDTKAVQDLLLDEFMTNIKRYRNHDQFEKLIDDHNDMALAILRGLMKKA